MSRVLSAASRALALATVVAATATAQAPREVVASTTPVPGMRLDTAVRQTQVVSKPSGDPVGQTQIAMMRDRPALGDTAEAMSLYLSAAAQGYVGAMSRLGIRYEMQRAWLDADFWFHLAADRHDYYALHALATVDRHASEYVKWLPAEALELAARHDEIARHIPGAGRPRSVVLVAPTAAEGGDARAQRWLGQMYAEGDGVTRNDSLAGLWLRRAAANGDVDAQALVAAHDRDPSHGWGAAEVAAPVADGSRAAFAEGASYLGHAYLEGRGVAASDSAAAYWLAAAARRGSAEARNTLGLMYAQGRGVAQDEVQAYALLTLGKDGASEQARATRLDIGARLTREQLEHARALAAEWDKN